MINSNDKEQTTIDSRCQYRTTPYRTLLYPLYCTVPYRTVQKQICMGERLLGDFIKKYFLSPVPIPLLKIWMEVDFLKN